jgi:hypothetical protein
MKRPGMIPSVRHRGVTVVQDSRYLAAGRLLIRRTMTQKATRCMVIALLCSIGLVSSLACQSWGADWRANDRPLVRPTAAAEQPLGVMQLPIEVRDGTFTADRYELQTGVARLLVTAHGGPYTLTIDPILAIHPLAADLTTAIDLDAPNPGEFRMKLNEGAAGFAILDVEPPGI